MSMDTKVREALRATPGEMSPEEGWDGLQRRLVRARMNALAGSALVILLVAAGTVAGVRLVASDGPGLANGDNESPPAMTDASAGYQLEIPDGWHEGGDPGNVKTLAPPDDSLPARAAFHMTISGKTFRDFDDYVTFRRRYLEKMGDSGYKVLSFDTQVASRRATLFEVTYPPETQGDDPCAFCHVTEYLIDWREGVVLHAILNASDEAAFDRFGSTATRALSTLSSFTNASTVSPTGTVAASIDFDQPTVALLGWLEARMAGAGAEDMLSLEAKAAFDRDGNLYREPSVRRDWVGYSVERAETYEDGSIYTVSLTTEAKPGEAGVARPGYSVAVGPGDNYLREARPVVILSVS